MSLRTALALLVLAAVAAGFGDQLGLLDGGSAEPTTSESGPVDRVVDGDTIKVRLADGLETVRLIGIDTPETVKPNTPVQCFGKAASNETKHLLTGERVRLVVGEEPRDKYARLLAYVYRERDDLFVNESLVERGFARTLTIAPNDRFASRFAGDASRAQASRRGLWAQC